MVTVIMQQVPNCHMIFADDPEQKHRGEDALLSYSMDMFLNSSDPDPELYLIYPMGKAVLQTTKAIKEFAVQKDMVDEGVGFVVMGASKRG